MQVDGGKGVEMMVKRFSWNSYMYLFFAIVILLVSWEHNRAMAAVVETDIPADSIRLRILANSDSMADQALKRQVRDAIVDEMNGWVAGPTTLEEARAIVREKLPELEAVVGSQIQRNGYDYTYQVELGVVPFPAKMYGNKVYPAGDYEAVRVTIGAGAGQNWWCVLFPPLCFVNTAKGEAVEKNDKAAEQTAAAKEDKSSKASKSSAAAGKDQAKKPADSKSKDDSGATAKDNGGSVLKKDSGKSAVASNSGEPLQDDGDKKPKKKVRFFLWDKVKSWFG